MPRALARPGVEGELGVAHVGRLAPNGLVRRGQGAHVRQGRRHLIRQVMHALADGHLVGRDPGERLPHLLDRRVDIGAREEPPVQGQVRLLGHRVRRDGRRHQLVGLHLLAAELGMAPLRDLLAQRADALERFGQTPDGVLAEMGLAAVAGLSPDGHVDVDAPAMPQQDAGHAHRQPAGVGAEAVPVEETERAAVGGLRLRVHDEHERAAKPHSLVDQDLQGPEHRREPALVLARPLPEHAGTVHPVLRAARHAPLERRVGVVPVLGGRVRHHEQAGRRPARPDATDEVVQLVDLDRSHAEALDHGPHDVPDVVREPRVGGLDLVQPERHVGGRARELDEGVDDVALVVPLLDPGQKRVRHRPHSWTGTNCAGSGV